MSLNPYLGLPVRIHCLDGIRPHKLFPLIRNPGVHEKLLRGYPLGRLCRQQSVKHMPEFRCEGRQSLAVGRREALVDFCHELSATLLGGGVLAPAAYERQLSHYHAVEYDTTERCMSVRWE